MRLSMATDLLNLREASSFRAESSNPAFPASSRMRDCCFSENFHVGTVATEVSGALAAVFVSRMMWISSVSRKPQGQAFA